jgi:TolB protein
MNRFSPSCHRMITAILAAFLTLGVFAPHAMCAEVTPGEPSISRYLAVVRPDGTGFKHLPRNDGQFYGSPDWSPDGKWIAYDTWSSGEDYVDARIEIMGADGSDVRIIGAGAMPSWSPDGTQIVAHTYDNPQSIVVMNVDGSGREMIIPHWGSPRWSPVGNRIISATGSGLSIFELATGKERKVLPRFSLHQGLSISPDGRLVCFADRSGNGALVLATLNEKTMDATGRILVNGGFFSHSSFSPDGRRLAFTWQPTPGKDIDQLYLMDIDGDKPPQKLAGLAETLASADPDWSPDGKLIVIATQVRQKPKAAD